MYHHMLYGHHIDKVSIILISKYTILIKQDTNISFFEGLIVSSVICAYFICCEKDVGI